MNHSRGFSIGPLSVIELTGADRNKILNNLCTQDLRSLADGQVKETFILDVKGRTLSHGIVACFGSQTLFISSPGQATRIVPHIDRYIIREDAQVRDVSSQYQALLFGPDTSDSHSMRNSLLAHTDCTEQKSDGAAVLWLRTRWLGPQTILALVSPQALGGEFLELSQRCQECDSSHRRDWEFQRIASFWPWYGVDIDEKNLPQEIGIDSRAISFHKGCYLGQETVARLDALGQVQKQLALVDIESAKTQEPQVPWELCIDGKSIGVVTSIAKTAAIDGSIEGRWIGLAMLRRGYFKAGGSWSLDEGETLKVLSTPSSGSE